MLHAARQGAPTASGNHTLTLSRLPWRARGDGLGIKVERTRGRDGYSLGGGVPPSKPPPPPPDDEMTMTKFSVPILTNFDP